MGTSHYCDILGIALMSPIFTLRGCDEGYFSFHGLVGLQYDMLSSSITCTSPAMSGSLLVASLKLIVALYASNSLKPGVNQNVAMLLYFLSLMFLLYL